MAEKWYTIRDDFAGPLDTGVWPNGGGSGGAASGGQLSVGVPAGVAAANSVGSDNNDLDESWVSLRVTGPGATLLSGEQYSMEFRLDNFSAGWGSTYTVNRDESANILQLTYPSGGPTNLAYNAQPYLAWRMTAGVLEYLYSLDGVFWTSLTSYTPTGGGAEVRLTISNTTSDADNASLQTVSVSELNAFAPTGSLNFVAAAPVDYNWNVMRHLGPLFETLVEPFDNLDAWTLGGSTGDDPTVVDGTAVFAVHNGESSDRTITTNDSYEVHSSWVSFQIKSAGTYPETLVNVSIGSLVFNALLAYPGHTGLTLAATGALVDLDGDAQPFILISGDSVNATVSYAATEGDAAAGTWTVLATEALDYWNIDQPLPLILGVTAFGPASSDYNIEYDKINMYGPEGLVGGGDELTEVDAAALVVSWNVAGAVNKTLPFNWNVHLFNPFLRHSSRHLHKSIFEYMKSSLADLNWNAGSTQPFNATKVYMQEELPDEWDGTGVLSPGTVAVTLGDEPAALNEELGGPLATISFPFFVDCFQDTDGIALALADDVRDILCGRLPNTSRFLTMTNWNIPESQNNYTIEFEDVVRERVRSKWHVVKATAVLYFPDSEGN